MFIMAVNRELKMRAVKIEMFDADTGERIGKSFSVEPLYADLANNRKIVTWLKSFLRGLHSGRNLSISIDCLDYHNNQKPLDLF